MTERRSITLPLCLLGAGAVHGLCVAAILPMLVTLPGPGSSRQGGPVIIDVDVLPVSTSSLPGANDSEPGGSGKIDDAPTSASALPDTSEPAPLPAPIEAAPAVAEAAPPAAAQGEAAPSEVDPIADVAVPAQTPPQAEPAEADSATDPMTTQSTTPMAEPDPPGEGPAKEVESTASGIDRLLQDADRSVAPAVSQAPAEKASVARAEPTSPEPSAAKLDTPAPTAKAPASRTAPNAKAPAKAGTPVAKKPGTAPAKRTVSRARPARAQAQATYQGGELQGFFGGVLAPPSAPSGGTTRRTTIQR